MKEKIIEICSKYYDEDELLTVGDAIDEWSEEITDMINNYMHWKDSQIELQFEESINVIFYPDIDTDLDQYKDKSFEYWLSTIKKNQ